MANASFEKYEICDEILPKKNWDKNQCCVSDSKITWLFWYFSLRKLFGWVFGAARGLGQPAWQIELGEGGDVEMGIKNDGMWMMWSSGFRPAEEIARKLQWRHLHLEVCEIFLDGIWKWSTSPSQDRTNSTDPLRRVDWLLGWSLG